MLWKKERSRIRAVKMNNLRGLLGVRKMHGVPNAGKRELCGMTKEVDERVLPCFGHVERIAKRV